MAAAASATAELIAAVARNDEAVTVVNLTNTLLSSSALAELVAALGSNTVVTALVLEGCQVRDGGARALAELLRDTVTLETLVLSDNGLTDDGVRSLANALADNTSLLNVDLSFNEISSEGVRPVAMALRTNASLRRLNLAVNQIGDEGVRSLANALCGGDEVRLVALGLARNSLTAACAADICRVIAESPLAQLALGDNRLGEEGAKKIAEALRRKAPRPSALELLDLSNNGIGEEGLSNIGIGIAVSSTMLRAIDLRRNMLGDRARRALASAEKSKPSISFLWDDKDKSGPIINFRGADADADADDDDDDDDDADGAHGGPSSMAGGASGVQPITAEFLKRVAALLDPEHSSTADAFVEALDSMLAAIREWKSTTPVESRGAFEVYEMPDAVRTSCHLVPSMCRFLQVPCVPVPTLPASQKRFGVKRTKVAEWIVTLAGLENSHVFALLAQNRVLTLLLGAFFDAQLNNILHTLVSQYVRSIPLDGVGDIAAELTEAGVPARLLGACQSAVAKKEHAYQYGHLVGLVEALEQWRSRDATLHEHLKALDGWSELVATCSKYRDSLKVGSVGGPAPPRAPPPDMRMSTSAMSSLLNFFSQMR